jgi:hypothetical protein
MSTSRFRRRTGAAALALLLAGTLVTTVAAQPDPAGAAVLPGPGQFEPLPPARLVNDVSVAAGTTSSFSLLGRGGVPASGVSALAFTVTTRSTGSGHLIVHSAGTATPGTSNLNYRPDIPTTNTVTTAVGTGGQISVRNAGTTAAARLWVDIAGYFTADAAPGAGSTYVALNPARIVNGTTTTAGGTLAVNPLGKGGVPAGQVTAVVANIVVRATATGTASVYPDGENRPVSTAVNYRGDFVYNNQVPVKLGANGQFRLFTSTAADVFVDVVGYYQAPEGTAAGGGFVATTPTRLPITIVQPNTTYTFNPTGQGGIPAAGAGAVAVNLTATQLSATGALTVFPAGAARPATNQLAYRVAGAWPTLQLAKTGTGGQVSVHNSGSTTVRLLIDTLGWFRAPGPPAAPTGVAAEAGDGRTVVRWTRPTGDGGASITGYRITASPGGATTDVVDVTSAVFANLSNDTPYTFTVAARNAAGLGPQSAAGAAVTPKAATAPGAPTAVTARARHTAAVVSWQRPADDGRLPIERYTVTASPGGATATVNAPGTEVEVPGLTDGIPYTFRVTATNARGTGPASAPGAAVVPSPGVPDQPADVVAAANGAGTVGVAWDAPAYDGGAAVTGYTLTVQPGGRTLNLPATTTETDVTGLTAGTEYTFAVTAANALGRSPAATTAPVTPDLVLQANTRLLSAAAQATVTSVTDTAVTFTDAPAEVTGVPVGTVLVAAEPPEPHEPFLVTVTGVTVSGATTTLAVRQASLPEAFTDAAFATVADLEGGAENALRAASVSESFGPVELTPGVRLSGTYTSTAVPDIQFSLRGAKRMTIRTTDRVELVVTSDRTIKNLNVERLLAQKYLLPKKLKKIVKWLKPDIRFQLHGFVRGTLHAGISARTAGVLEGTMTVNLADPEKSTFSLSERYERPYVGAQANGDLTFGVRVGLAATTWKLRRAEVLYTQELRGNVNVNADPWWTVDSCTHVDVQTEPFFFPPVNPFPINVRPYSDCDPVARAGGPLHEVAVVPGDITLAPGGTATFRTQSSYGPGTPRWSVDGTGNGTIDAGGRYTAPNKNGIFAVVATIDATGGRPAQRGTAYVRVGAPPTPTLTVTALPALADGTTRVRAGMLADGAPPALWRVRVEPPNPASPCYANAWIILGLANSSELYDRLAADTSVRCDILRVGGTYRFYLTAMNAYGNSAEAASLPVTILGPGAGGPVAARSSGGVGIGGAPAG